jgi:arginine-tRNA-protein transferase
MKHFNTPPGNTTKISRSHKGKNNTFDLDRSMEVVSDRLRIVLDTSEVTPEKYDLYKRYQVTIHNDDEDDVSEDQFKRFLCDNPFTDYTEPDDANPRGHFHQLYYWDNTLFAIGVIDVLPLCVSSVYFVWDPAWAKWGLGKLGSLQEIALAKRLGLPYYYMGFYIHDCVKMRYKGQFSPSYLLDPWFTEYNHNSQRNDLSDAVDGVWFPLTKFDKLLDKKKLVSLLKPDATYDGKSRFKSLLDADMPGVLKQEDLQDVAFDKIPVMFKIDNQTVLLTPDLFAGNGANTIRGILKDIVAAVGKAIGSTIVLDMSVYA